MGPFLKMAALSVAVMALMLFGHVRALECSDGQRERLTPDGPQCVFPTIIEAITEPPESDGGVAANYLTSLDISYYTLSPREAVSLEWKTWRSETFYVTLQTLYEPDIWFAVYENGKFKSEVNARVAYIAGGGYGQFSYLASGSGYGKGLWKVVVTNWGSTPQIADFGSDTSFTHSCENRFELNPLTLYDKRCFAILTTCPDDTLQNPEAGLTPAACVYNPCDDPTEHRLFDGTCAAPNLAQNAPNVYWLNSIDNGSGAKEVKLIGSSDPVSLTYAVGGAVLDLSKYHADTLKVTIPAQASGKVFVRVTNNGVLVEGGEYKPTGVLTPSQKTFIASGGGSPPQWVVAVVNYDPAGAQPFDPATIGVSLSCSTGYDFSGTDIRTCLVEPAPQCPGDEVFKTDACAYNPCDDLNEHRLADGTCAAPNLAENAPGVHWLTYDDNGSGAKEVKFIGSGNSVSLTYAVGGAVLDLSKYHADTLKVKIPAQASNKVFVRVTNNGVLVGGGEYKPIGMQASQMTFTSSGNDQGNRRHALAQGGDPPQWVVAVVNYDPDGARNVMPVNIEVLLSCASGYDFSGTDIRTCLVEPPVVEPPPPPPATTCAYTSAVGFNVWSRWNIFTLEGVELDGGEVEGRVAAVGTVKGLRSALVHTKPEAFISPKENAAKGGPWSITAKGAVTLSKDETDGPAIITTVLNGGVETTSTITKTNVVVAGNKEAQQLSELSANVDAAAAYYIARSDAWNSLTPTYIEQYISTSEIRVQLHGKVNVIRTESLAGIEKITLTGHPLGTLIINSADAAGDTVSLSKDLKVTYQGRNGSSAEPLTFGRVVLNFNAATNVEFPRGAKDSPPIDVSILAPKASVSFDLIAVRGNVVAKSFSGTDAIVGVLPFGTRLVSGGGIPTKKPFTSQGKRATACLWHTL